MLNSNILMQDNILKKKKITSFYLTKYPITYGQYQAFVNDPEGFEQLRWWQGMPVAYQRQPLYPVSQPHANYPREGLSWYQAMAFARWLNQQLQGLTLKQPQGKDFFRVGENAQISGSKIFPTLP